MQHRDNRSRRALFEALEDRRLLSTVGLDFSGGAGGIADTGFTGVLSTSRGKGLIPANIALGGGKLTIASTAGDLWTTNNTQDDALDLPANTTADFAVQTRITAFPFNKNWQLGGEFAATDQDNYVRLNVAWSNGPVVALSSETGGVFTVVSEKPISFAGLSTLDLRLVGTAASKTLTAYYRANSDSDSAWVPVASVVNPAVFSTAGKAGVLTSNVGSSSPVTVPFDSFSLTTNAAPTSAPAISVGPNKNISRLLGSQAEQKIAINPANPNNIVAVAMNGPNNSSSLVVSRSTDGGVTWSTSYITGATDGCSSTTPRVDPAVAFDSFGNCYISYLVAKATNEVRIAVARSSNGGASFSGAVALGGAGANPDSEKIATGPDATNPARQAIWIAYTDDNISRVRAVYATSTGLGQLSSFSAPTTVNHGSGRYATPAVGPKGEVAVTWQSPDGGSGPSNIYVNVDPDGAGTAANFGSTDRVASKTNLGGWTRIPAQPDRSVDAEPSLAFDRSGGTANGRLYLIYTDSPAAGSADTNIMLRSSADLGATWSAPVRVNDDRTANSQFLPALAVDQTTGNVGVSWYDARNSSANNSAQIYAAVSTNHGASFLPNVQMAPGLSNQAWANDKDMGYMDFGDYTGLAFHAGKLMPVWADNSNSTHDNANGSSSLLDTYTAIVTVNA